MAVVGGGVFGTTISWTLAKNGFKVDLFEKKDDIFLGASGINQYRAHRGYHYPRSIETILTCIKGEQEFRKVYKDSLLSDNIENYYCIAKEGSLVSSQHCMDVWDKCGLDYIEMLPQTVRRSMLSASFKVKENIFDHTKLRSLIWEKLKRYNVNVLLNSEVKYDHLKEYDFVIVATYVDNNSFLDDVPLSKKPYQFEVCEKLVLKLPLEFTNLSVVIIDGPFMCVDPFGETGNFVMGNVKHAILDREIGTSISIKDKYRQVLNKGVVKNPPFTNFKKMIDSASQYFKGIQKAEHLGSMFTIRTVLPFRDHDDARPTTVEQINDRLITVFSGKIPTCINAANEVLHIIKTQTS